MTRIRDNAIDPSQPSLIVQHGNTPKKWRPLKADVTVIGRARTCDMELASDQIAPVHCILAHAGGKWLLRDCGSPVGTHVNGELVHEIILKHGDEIQIGTFSFTTHFAEGAATAESPEPAPEGRIQRDCSRRKLATLALNLRRRLRDAQARITEAQALAPPALPAEFAQQTEALQAKIRDYDLRLCRLEQAERALALDRETINEGYACLTARAERTECDLARRKAETEIEIRTASEQLNQRRQEMLAETASHSVPALTEESVRLNLRRKELGAFASHLRRERLRIRDREMELAVERVRLAKLAQSFAQDREHRRKDETSALRKPIFLTRQATSPTAASS
jgi:predicted component of type VI protein secretion system